MTAVAQASRNAGMEKKAGKSRIAIAIIWISLLLGFVLRIARWAHFRSLWLDEIYLAGSIVTRSMHDLLFKPLDNWQASPAGYLFLTHLSMTLFGTGERSLRLIPLLFGLASLPLMLAVSRRMLGIWGVAVAMAAFSVMGPLIYYCTEVKPYACDVAVSLAITLAALKWVDERNTRNTIVAGIVGAIGVFLSYPAIFVLGGAGIWIAWTQRGEARRKFGAIALIWIIAFAADYLIFVRPYAVGDAHAHVVQYWLVRNTFMPRSPVQAIHWIFSSLNTIASDPGGMWLEYPNAALIGLLIGAAIALRSRGRLLLALAPLPLVWIAAAAKQYPFGDRLALFFVPQYLLLIAAAAEALWSNVAGKAAAVVIAGLIVIPSAQRAVGYLISPYGREESLPVYRWAAADFKTGDVVYLSHYAEPSFDYYAQRAGWPIDLRQAGAVHVQTERMRPEQIIADVDAYAGRTRVWIILIHPESDKYDVQGLTLAEFDRIGHPIAHREDNGVLGYLYDCTKPASN